MSDVPVFLLANLVVQDAAEYCKYEKGFFPILKRHGVEFVTCDDQPHTFEGSAPRPGRIIIFKFPSEDQAALMDSIPAISMPSQYRASPHESLILGVFQGRLVNFGPGAASRQ